MCNSMDYFFLKKISAFDISFCLSSEQGRLKLMSIFSATLVFTSIKLISHQFGNRQCAGEGNKGRIKYVPCPQ